MELKRGEVSTGTTIMAVQYDGGVILGADSRVSTGTYVSSRAADKLTALHDSIYCCRSGSAADTQAVTDYVRYFLSSHSIEVGAPPRVQAAANLVRKVCYNNKDNLLAGMIVAGWDPIKGGQVYEINLGGSCVRQQASIGGSGSTYIYGLMDSEFRPGMSKEETIAFVKKAVAHAMCRDGSSGGVIRILCIDATGVHREFLAGDALPFGP